MSGSSPNRPPSKGLFGSLARGLEAKLAPVFVQTMGDRYYDQYSRSLALASEQLQVLDGLPAATMERGHMSLLLSTPQNPTATFKIWGALALSSRLLIVGPTGSGKSTLLRSLAWQLAGRDDPDFVSQLTFKLFGQAVPDLMPVWVDLYAFAHGSGSLEEAMLASMARLGFPAAAKYLRERLASGQCILLLDGLEHVRDAAKQAQIAEQVQAHPNNIWVLTTRCALKPPTLPGFLTMQLRGMAPSDVATYLDYYLGAHSLGANEVLAACERSASLAQLARMPLMLAAMSRLFRTPAVTSGRLSTLCGACLELVLGGWGGQEAAPSGMPREVMLGALQRIAHGMQSRESATLGRAEILALLADLGRAEPLLDELIWRTGVLCPTLEDASSYAFIAPILQSYLAAQHIVATQQSPSLLPLADTPWWQDTIVLTASLLPEPISFIRGIQSYAHQEPQKWFLLANCLAEVPSCEDTLCAEVRDHLFALLEGETDGCWQGAACGIAGMARKQYREYFTTLIKDPDAEMRRRAVLTLGRLRQDWSIPSLGSAISSDPEPKVRQQAVWALGFIPSVHAVPVLARALRSPFKGVREAAAKSLSMLGKSPELLDVVVHELLGALGEENEEAAHLAEQALAPLGRPAVPQLIAALNDKRMRPAQRSRVAKALGRLGDEHALPVLIEAILSGSADDTESYVEATVGIGATAVPALITALEGRDVTTSAGLVAALVRIGGPAVEPLIEAIGGTEPGVRNAAVRALEGIGTATIEPLTQALLHDSRFEVRRRALEILGHISGTQVASALVDALKDEDQGVRLNAVRYLGTFGHADAMPLLIDILRKDAHLPLRKTVIESLSAIGDPGAIPALLAALEEPALREVTVVALTKFSQQAVEPLIRQLHMPTTRNEIREALWGVLERIGATVRPEEETLFGLASAYARLRDGGLSVEDTLALTERLKWWQYGPELHQSLATAHALAGLHELGDIGGCGMLFDWVSEISDWLRPQIRNILWSFKRDIVENIKLYRTLNRRDSQRDALLSTVDRLADLQGQVQTSVLPFERIVLEKVVINWRNAVQDAIKQLRGRAALTMELLTPSLPLRPGQSSTTAVFRIFNQGDSAARNFAVTVRPAALQDVEVPGGERKSLDPLGIAETRQVEINLAPHGATKADLSFEAHYDDDEREGVTQPFGVHINFYDAPTVYTPIPSSPYVAGQPIKTADMFFGREDILGWVKDNISSTHQMNALLLYGERRMGKTSVLYQLWHKPPDPRHVYLLFDLQLYSYMNTVPELLFQMATEIVGRLGQEGVVIDDPNWEQYESDAYSAFRSFCALLDRTLGERRVVVMLDEFGMLMVKVRNHVFENDIFNFMRGLIQASNTITFLFTGAYEVRRMQEDYDSILFNMVKVRKISYLEPREVQDLITKPVEGLLSYHPLVVDKIQAVTACHPYFVQLICDGLVRLARSERRNDVQLADLDVAIREVVRDATGNIEKSIYNYLGDTEKLILAALANATDDVRLWVTEGDIAGVLEPRNMGIPREEMREALKALEERDLIAEMRIGQQLRYSFRMGLVRMWLRQNEMLLRLSKE